MVNGPPCAVCGFTLRWLPQQASWGCDRCQRMFPASGPGAPQQAAAPAQPQPSPWAPPGAAPSGFAPPQQQGFAPPQPGAPAQQRAGFAPPQQGFAPPGTPPPGAPPQGYAPPQQGFAPPHGAPPPGNPYAPGGAGAPPYGGAPPGANPYAAGAPYAPQPGAPPVTPPPPGKKSSKGLVIGLAVAAVAIAGGVVAFVVLRGGGGAAGGGSRDAVVKATLSALERGDVDRLIALADPVGLHEKVVDCSGKTKPREPSEDDDEKLELSEKDKEDRDPKKQLEKRRKELEEVAPLAKGAKIELVEIVSKEPPAPSDDDNKNNKNDDKDEFDSMVMKSGQRLMKGCVSKVPMRIQMAKLKLKVTPEGETAFDQEAEIMLLQVGKGFWLANPPRISLGAGALVKELTAIKDQVCACKDAACAQKLKEEFKASPRRKKIKKEVKALAPEDREKVDKVEDEIKACERKLDVADAIGAMEQFKSKMCACTDRVCVDKVTQEMIVWSKSHADDGDDLAPEDRERVTKISEELSRCMMKVADAGGGGGGIGETIASIGGGDAELAPVDGMPAACEDYRQVLIKLSGCAAMPEQSRKAIKDGYKAMMQAFENLRNAPPESIKAVEDGCRQGADAIKQAMGTMGC